MNWDAVGALAEVAAAVVVVISIVYLASQVRQTNLQAQAAAHADWLIGWNATIKGWIESPETVSILQRGWADFDSLSHGEQAIFHLHHSALTNHWLLAGQLCDRGLLPESIYQGATEVLISVHSTPGGRAVLERNAPATPRGPELLAMVEAGEGSLPPINELYPWWSPDEAELDRLGHASG
jgi:hypothetical protein